MSDNMSVMFDRVPPADKQALMDNYQNRLNTIRESGDHKLADSLEMALRQTSEKVGIPLKETPQVQREENGMHDNLRKVPGGHETLQQLGSMRDKGEITPVQYKQAIDSFHQKLENGTEGKIGTIPKIERQETKLIEPKQFMQTQAAVFKELQDTKKVSDKTIVDLAQDKIRDGQNVHEIIENGINKGLSKEEMANQISSLVKNVKAEKATSETKKGESPYEGVQQMHSLALLPTTEQLSEAGKVIVDSIKKGANSAKDYLAESKKNIPIAKNLQDSFDLLKTRAAADEIRAKQLLDKIKLDPKDAEAIYHHMENRDEPLTPEQEKIYNETVKPISDESKRLYEKLKNDGIPLDNDTYVTRFVKNRGTIFDRIVEGKKTAKFSSALLRRTSPSFKSRTMKALVDEQSNRVTASIKDGKVTIFNEDKKPVTIGTLNLKRNSELRAKELEPLIKANDKAQKEINILTKSKAREESAGTPRRINTLKNEIESNNIKMADISKKYSDEELNKKTFTDSVFNKKWTIEDATTKEIERDTNLEYHKNALLNTLVTYNRLEKIDRAEQFLKDFKESPEFGSIAKKIGDGEIPDTWRMTHVPQCIGYAFEPRIADVLDRYAKSPISFGA